MKLQRFWIAGKISADDSFGGLLEVVDPSLLHQLKNVFRFKIGYELIIFDGDGLDNECIIREFLKDKVILEPKKSYPSRFMPTREIWLCASIIKKDNFEWTVEKATELGVTRIIPILSDRSEKKALNVGRLEKIAVEASEQSGRGNVPAIHPIIKLEDCLEYINKTQVSGEKLGALAFHTEGEPFLGSAFDKEKPTAIFIGPEGGWSEREVELFHTSGIKLKCLGKQILRAETAAIAALSQFVFYFSNH